MTTFRWTTCCGKFDSGSASSVRCKTLNQFAWFWSHDPWMQLAKLAVDLDDSTYRHLICLLVEDHEHRASGVHPDDATKSVFPGHLTDKPLMAVTLAYIDRELAARHGSVREIVHALVVSEETLAAATDLRSQASTYLEMAVEVADRL